ncbi:unnamed protein product [Rotaria magnacalcarata]|uniref:Integrase catalytic domain-containing protein n=1 Tax=Rotaria magnacalcarata TaxID=392030 RepID=A0A816YWF1_9BILA|nr:unnamed protein product [Rotaria magnacalcarata]
MAPQTRQMTRLSQLSLKEKERKSTPTHNLPKKTTRKHGNHHLIENVYYNPGKSGSFGGYKTLRNNLSKEIKNEDIYSFLKKSDAYTLHRRALKRYKTPHTVAFAKSNVWQSDLADLSQYSRYNNNHKFILFVIDVYTRKAYARPLKDKSGKTVADSLLTIFKENGSPPGLLMTDLGKEYLNQNVSELLKAYSVRQYQTQTG